MHLFLHDDRFNHEFINDFMVRISQPLSPDILAAAERNNQPKENKTNDKIDPTPEEESKEPIRSESPDCLKVGDVEKVVRNALVGQSQRVQIGKVALPRDSADISNQKRLRQSFFQDWAKGGLDFTNDRPHEARQFEEDAEETLVDDGCDQDFD